MTRMKQRSAHNRRKTTVRNHLHLFRTRYMQYLTFPADYRLCSHSTITIRAIIKICPKNIILLLILETACHCLDLTLNCNNTSFPSHFCLINFIRVGSHNLSPPKTYCFSPRCRRRGKGQQQGPASRSWNTRTGSLRSDPGRTYSRRTWRPGVSSPPPTWPRPVRSPAGAAAWRPARHGATRSPGTVCAPGSLAFASRPRPSAGGMPTPRWPGIRRVQLSCYLNQPNANRGDVKYQSVFLVPTCAD